MSMSPKSPWDVKRSWLGKTRRSSMCQSRKSFQKWTSVYGFIVISSILPRLQSAPSLASPTIFNSTLNISSSFVTLLFLITTTRLFSIAIQPLKLCIALIKMREFRYIRGCAFELVDLIVIQLLQTSSLPWRKNANSSSEWCKIAIRMVCRALHLQGSSFCWFHYKLSHLEPSL